MDPNSGGPFGLLLIGCACLLVVLWGLLPFAVFGIKSRLDKINENLERLLRKGESPPKIN